MSDTASHEDVADEFGPGREPATEPSARPVEVPPPAVERRSRLERRQAERRLRETLDRIQRQFRVAGRASQLEAVLSGDVESFARDVTILAAEATGCERVNVWLFNDEETELHCLAAWEATPRRHTSGMVLREPEFRSEFQALKSARFVDADDPLNDPRTAGYAESYVKPCGITSMLDAVVRVSDRNLGLLCFEHVGQPHHWEPDEIAFACQMADKIGLAIMSRIRQRSAERLQQSEAALAEAQAIARVGSWSLDSTTGAMALSKESYRIYGVDPATFVPTYEAMIGRIHPEDQRTARRMYERAAQTREPFAVDYRIVLPGGESRFVHARGRVSDDARAGSLRWVGTVQDITERKRAEETLVFANTLLRTEMETSPDGMLVVGRDRRVVSFNAKFADMWGIPTALLEAGDEEPVQQAVAARLPDPEGYQARLATFAADSDAAGHDELHTTDGRFIDRHTSALRTPEGVCLGRVWYFRDITDRRLAEEQIRQLARRDSLTGLANRAVFVEDVRRAIARTRRGARTFAVLYLDLDHFKDVNDTLGHPAGDTLLQTVAARLRAHVRETDTVARFGGDEFAVIVTDIEGPLDAATLARTLIEALRQPFAIGGNDILTGASIGIAVYDRSDEVGAETLLSHADVALYHVKSEGRDGYRFFTPQMDAEVRTRVALTAELREAIAEGQLFLDYQPQVEIATGCITGVEALVRWRHAARGVLKPDLFIRAAEDSGLIRPLSRWVLRESCRQAVAWRGAGGAPVRLSINLSGGLFKMAAELGDDIDVVLRETGFPAHALEVELTETILMRASIENSGLLERLRGRGIRVAIDDFGTGYSSLDYLRRFPVDRIKIAQDFVAHIIDSQGSAAIVKTTITLARELGIEVIAEGVESDGQLQLLEAWGCEHAQGYHFARPLSATAMLPLLRAGRLPVAGDAPARPAAARRGEGRGPSKVGEVFQTAFTTSRPAERGKTNTAD
jgi:diguanylate cyclase (GGDEF)-like protein/PAS domain S-box-containing protein